MGAQKKFGREFEKHLGKSKTGLRNDNDKNLIMEKSADDHYKNMKYSTSGNKCKKSPCNASELEVLKKMQEHRKKGQKVSKHFVKTIAKTFVLEQ